MSAPLHLQGSLQIQERVAPHAPRPGARGVGGTEFQALLSATRGRGTEVQATRTELSGEQASEALSHAWTELFGEPPSKATLAIVTAQWAHETGSGKSMFNYNFGGIKGTSPSGLTTLQRTREGHGESQRVIVDGFRAYRTKEEGALDYVALLKRRYPDAIERAREGDPAGFVRELKQGGYFTGNEQLYTRSITRLAQQALSTGMGVLGDGSVLPDRELLIRPVEHTVPGLKSEFDVDLGTLVDRFHTDAMLDEMSRAALRIAASSLTRNGRESR